MAVQDPVWTYGETKLIVEDPYWSYGENEYYGAPIAVAGPWAIPRDKVRTVPLFFYSDTQASVTLDNTGASDLALPSVTIPANALPLNATIDKVYCYLKYGSRKDTSGADNAINGNQYVQVAESVAGVYTNAIKIIDDTLPIDISEITIMGGDVISGNIEVSATVATENKTYDFQWLNCKVDGNNLILYDVQCIIEVRWNLN